MYFDTTPEEARLLARVAQCMHTQRKSLAEQLMLAIYGSARTHSDASIAFDELEDWKKETINTVVDLTEAWFSKNTAFMGKLLAGWIASQLGPMRLHDTNDGLIDAATVVGRMSELWVAALEGILEAPAIQAMSRMLNQVSVQLAKPLRTTLNVLYVGDCLLPEIMTSLTGLCVEAQIGMTHTFLHEHVAAVLRNQIRALAREKFDLVFFSPFTYTFTADYAQLLSGRAVSWDNTKFMTVVDAMLVQVQETAIALHRQFDCPIYIHNTAGVVQSFGTWSGFAKNVIAQYRRKSLRALVGQRLDRMLADPIFNRQLRLIDERILLRRANIRELGKVFFHGVIFHPTRIGVELAENDYFKAVYTTAFLVTKKVIVCDLDNTLWSGVIGEGSVTHLHERQRTLKSLRDKGVLLSINSKNDPANIHFTGSVLQMGDFVAPQINWQPKVDNMSRILKELNLKVKDFIFLDDRPDELERMQRAFPELLVLNAEELRTWELLATWQQNVADKPDEEDRTRLYHERLARDQYVAGLEESRSSLEDERSALSDLQISIKLESVPKAGLKRVVELINRTNQFNLCGSRTSMREMEAGLGVKHWIVAAAARDKFGNMGVVGAMKVERVASGLQIPIFVLSCRVFGLGIEYALLNSVVRFSGKQEKLIGAYSETPSNKPARDLYPNSGFSWDGQHWIGHTSTLASDPAWLTIENAVTQQAD